ncbi:MAG TPA: hypothetical protein VKU41_19165 [Polyangiaceae bacterium]|nr:hypothetical protein [Polyangiaceae bacterium]
MPVAQRKRPFYLVLALLGALALGTIGTYEGGLDVVLYRGMIDTTAATQDIADEANRDAVDARLRSFLKALDANKKFGWPLGVGTFLLGTAVFVFAMRTLGGSGAARAAVVQLVAAQAAVHAASFWLMREAEDARVRFALAKQEAEYSDQGVSHARAPDATVFQRIVNPAAFGAYMLGSGFVILALTRRRSREFFDPGGTAVEER